MMTSSLCEALIASTALSVSISALASSISALMPRCMVWGILCFLACASRLLSRRPDACSVLHDAPQRGVGTDSGLAMAPPLERRRAALRPGHVFPLPHQFLHRSVQTLDRDRVHAFRKQPADDGGRFRIVPVPLRHRIEPHRMRISARDALEP